ncbi:MAG: hypothetical protein A3G33_07425 [Omnitrophica bacterium RIFCSPLOWO2_12_FULL_44_17]|uniref:HTH cro/C1-type domain-containing protein n=1 Tax=Candidatus Danuiimicrobium aquiferis TaxID=1801832 RepID=A0A1G1KYS1_9BACT|nr:MAG: hypothetical protein A3B72_07725 [Omnitrophica bacterium RIFCSPHIGHO2_02_FULL_45_28]OGW88851.1 MAG: hypothetical protein A3E74_01005 [Omnitrophica bacterium RIFCSPHIGHO2_12_FULL_44_12]OGW98054.1 MAG: hypothetical protein A3G33_07425 [Omnitrophica bacterium RIFCSPLOWO2_12_FULL_44_17]OGX03504.1 MAG: hypothetical protein A3J12_02805 [Omnitrophica bacterium RIFCSPLOWO2_02_FULL_44_11]
MAKKIQSKTPHPARVHATSVINPGDVIRRRRLALELREIDLAKAAGIQPGTLDAIEKGRVKNPSVSFLCSIAQALGISVASLFSEIEEGRDHRIFTGNQKGVHVLEFPKNGARIICYTPIEAGYFVGKVLLRPGAKIERKLLATKGHCFAQSIIGKLILEFDKKEYVVKEGDYVCFEGQFPYSFNNSQMKETSFLLITIPSFLAAGSR